MQQRQLASKSVPRKTGAAALRETSMGVNLFSPLPDKGLHAEALPARFGRPRRCRS
ncbi:MAG: hypothetical protein VB124_02975 [Burkholderia sp.]